jgi:cytochrome c-type biogenesis protein CcmH
MTLFLCIAASMSCVAALMMARPAFRRGRLGRPAALAREVDAMGVQLRQLGALHQAGALTDAQYAQSKALVERKLIDAIAAPSTAAGVPPVARPSNALTAALIAFMFAVAGSGYWLLGSPSDLEVAPGAPVQAGADAAPHELTGARIDAMVDSLANRLASKPDDAQGWLMLARSYVALGKHAEAVAAFVKAQRLLPDDAGLLADYADALAMTRQRRLEGEPSALIRRALELDANNAKALALAGTAAFDRKDYRDAVRYWETLVKMEAPDGPFAGQVRAGIDEARRLAGMPVAGAAAVVAPVASAPPAAPAATATVAGTITLAPDLKARVSPDDTLFVFARAVDGPRMPLAILRKRVKDLPLRFTLDDSLAMSPTATLSSVPRVIVGARISKSGNAMPQGGDLQGTGTAVAVGATGLQVEINQEVAR